MMATTSVTATVLGRSIAEAVAFLLQQREWSTEEPPGIRILDVQPSEAPQLVRDLCGLQAKGFDEPVQIIVNSEPWDGADRDLFVGADRTPTYYRNRNRTGLVYIPLREGADEQGLQRMFTIRDQSWLDGQIEDAGLDLRALMLRHAWAVMGGEGIPLPGTLSGALDQVLKHLHPRPMEMPVRLWLNYLCEIARGLVSLGRPSTAEEVQAVVARSLHAVHLFPDEALFMSGTETKFKARLVNNYWYSDLMQPNGNEIDEDDLITRIHHQTFKDEAGNELSTKENEEWRHLCIEYVKDTDKRRDLRHQITYRIFSQLFEQKSSQVLLGERCRMELAPNGHDYEQQYNDLGVEEGLNTGSSEDAQKLLSTGLPELLREDTRRKVERLAAPKPIGFEEPFGFLMELVEEARDEALQVPRAELVVELEAKAADDPLPSGNLFAFLFGPSLREVQERSLVEDGLVIRFDDRLLIPGLPPELPNTKDDSGEEEDSVIVWDGITIRPRLYAIAEEGQKAELLKSWPARQWAPEHLDALALSWLFASAEDAPTHTGAVRLPHDISLREWIQRAIYRAERMDAREEVFDFAHDVEHLVEALIQDRNEFLRSSATEGLSVSKIQDYVIAWNRTMSFAVEALVPKSSPIPALDMMMGIDSVAHRDGILMLATHPLRLRWVAKYLEQRMMDLERALTGKLRLNPINPKFYAAKVAALSPHRTPAIHSVKQQELCLATEELGWCEIFTPIKMGGRDVRHWLQGADDASVKALAVIVKEYLAAYPYKRDGLSVVIPLTMGGDFARKLVEAIRQGDNRNCRIILHILADPDHHKQLRESLSELEVSVTGGLIPDVEVLIHAWRGGAASLYEIVGETIDLAVVPNLFGNHTSLIERTRPCASRHGRNDVLYDPPTYKDIDPNGGNISMVLLPFRQDDQLDAWSTLAVREARSAPVGSGEKDDIDYATIQVRFESNRDLFNELHALAHWVITLDPFVGRDQIEALEDAPDIITVKQGIGKSGLYTIVVSSSAGKDFIIKRLEKRIQTLPAIPGDTVGLLASTIYDGARRFVPGAVLRALGLGKTAQELMGLMVARYLVDRQYPHTPQSSFLAWLSLDEFTKWFEGQLADLMRIDGWRDEEGRLHVKILLVEAKFRATDASNEARQQLTKSRDLFLSALQRPEADASDEMEYSDANFWRRDILMAMEQASRGALLGPEGKELTHLPADDREDWLEGRYIFEGIETILAMCRHDEESGIRKTESGFHIGADGISELIKEMLKHEPIGEPLEATVEQATSEPGSSSETGKSASTSVVPEAGLPSEPAPEPAATVISTDVGDHVTSQASPPAYPLERVSIQALHTYYQRILDTLGEFGVKVARVEGAEAYMEGPASVCFKVLPQSGVRVDTIYRLQEELKLKLELPSDRQIRMYVDRGTVNLEVPKREEERNYFNTSQLWSGWTPPGEGKLTAPLGVDQEGQVVSIDFSSSNSPHLLVAGTTGSGKSIALGTLLHGLTRFYSPEQLRLLLIDPKGTELVEFEGTPHLEGQIGWSAEDAVEVLDRAVTEMQRRYAMFKEARVRDLAQYNASCAEGDRLPWWLVVLDEYADLTSDKDDKKAVEALLQRLTQKARAAGIHVIVATQKPTATVISTVLRSNLPIQLALRVKSAVDSKVILDESGAEALNGKGDAFLKVDGRMIRLQCAYHPTT